jgi:hypothetical protein
MVTLRVAERCDFLEIIRIPSMKMTADKRAIDKIYRRRDRYEIPDWQRQKVWSKKKKQGLSAEPAQRDDLLFLFFGQDIHRRRVNPPSQ